MPQRLHLRSKSPAAEAVAASAAGLLQKLHLSAAPILILASSAAGAMREPRMPWPPPVTVRPSSLTGVVTISMGAKPGGRVHNDGSRAKRAIARAADATKGQRSCGGGLA